MAIRQTIKSMSEVLSFGKFKGTSIAEVMKKEASYLLWLDKEEIVEFSITDEDWQKIEKEAHNQHMDYLSDEYGGETEVW